MLKLIKKLFKFIVFMFLFTLVLGAIGSIFFPDTPEEAAARQARYAKQEQAAKAAAVKRAAEEAQEADREEREDMAEDLITCAAYSQYMLDHVPNLDNQAQRVFGTIVKGGVMEAAVLNVEIDSKHYSQIGHGIASDHINDNNVKMSMERVKFCIATINKAGERITSK